MKSYRITILSSGADPRVHEGADAEAAHDAMMRGAGYVARENMARAMHRHDDWGDCLDEADGPKVAWFKFRTYNTEAQYGYGDATSAHRFVDRLDEDRDNNLYAACALSGDEVSETRRDRPSRLDDVGTCSRP